MNNSTSNSTPRPIYQIAEEIIEKWTKMPDYILISYVTPMLELNTIDDYYYADDAESVILYFLSNAESWRGDDARRLKAELKQICKSKSRN